MSVGVPSTPGRTFGRFFYAPPVARYRLSNGEALYAWLDSQVDNGTGTVILLGVMAFCDDPYGCPEALPVPGAPALARKLRLPGTAVELDFVIGEPIRAVRFVAAYVVEP